MRTVLLSISFFLLTNFHVSALAGTDLEASQSSEQATLIVYRPAQNVAVSGVSYRVFLDRKHIQRLRVNEHITLQIDPGAHTLMANDKKKSKIEFEAGPRETIYVKASVKDAKTRKMQWSVVHPSQAQKDMPLLSDVIYAAEN